MVGIHIRNFVDFLYRKLPKLQKITQRYITYIPGVCQYGSSSPNRMVISGVSLLSRSPAPESGNSLKIGLIVYYMYVQNEWLK